MDKVLWFEIPVDDVERARKFYKAAFKWGIQPMPDSDYTMVTTTEVDQKTMMPKEAGINGGLPKRSASIKAPVVTISVDDIEEATKRIEKAGGKKVGEKINMGQFGFAAYFKDSEGNMLGLWELPK